MTEKLKPCPFCGHEAEKSPCLVIDEFKKDFGVLCSSRNCLIKDRKKLRNLRVATLN